MEHRNLIIGAAAIGTVGYLCLRGGSRKPQILTDEEIAKRQADTAALDKKIAEGVAPNAVNGYSMAGEPLTYEQAEQKLATLAREVGESQEKLLQDQINLNKAGLTEQYLAAGKSWVIDANDSLLGAQEVADFYVNYMQPTAFFQNSKDDLPVYESARKMLEAYGFDPDKIYSPAENETMLDNYANIRRLRAQVMEKLSVRADDPALAVDESLRLARIYADLSNLREKVLLLTSQHNAVQNRLLDPAKPSREEKAQAKRELALNTGAEKRKVPTNIT